MNGMCLINQKHVFIIICYTYEDLDVQRTVINWGTLQTLQSAKHTEKLYQLKLHVYNNIILLNKLKDLNNTNEFEGEALWTLSYYQKKDRDREENTGKEKQNRTETKNNKPGWWCVSYMEVPYHNLALAYNPHLPPWPSCEWYSW